jgi:hypothetical protein
MRSTSCSGQIKKALVLLCRRNRELPWTGTKINSRHGTGHGGKIHPASLQQNQKSVKSRQQNRDLAAQKKSNGKTCWGLSTRAGNSIWHRELETGQQSQQWAKKSNRAGEGVHPRRRRKTERENLTGAQNRIDPGPCLAEELNSERETLTEEIAARLRASK